MKSKKVETAGAVLADMLEHAPSDVTGGDQPRFQGKRQGRPRLPMSERRVTVSVTVAQATMKRLEMIANARECSFGVIVDEWAREPEIRGTLK